MTKQLVKGNEAIVYGALLGGATHFFGYPITPASEIAHAAALYFPKTGREFLQAESEVAAINMIYGAAGAGGRAMTASSGPGVSLMAEGISYLAGAELPCVIVDIQRAGPGLGNIWPEQGDYNTVVKSGAHGNYQNVVFAPASAQEMCDFTYQAFEIADKYRVVVFILSDAYIGQMMEPIEIPNTPREGDRKDWALYADAESRKNLITSIFMNQQIQSDHNKKLQNKYRLIEHELLAYEEEETDEADVIFVAYGICARICYTAMEELRTLGIKIGMLRPQMLFPFPSRPIQQLAQKVKKCIVVELSDGQMAVDVKLAVNGAIPVLEYNWMGGVVPTVKEIVERVQQDMKGGAK
ncbi:MAG: 3-methyl-2-oxobutanoate dehydrogenase subunit VorB [Fibrobacteria bacterium]|nr:3-methyl-2-oxobutanoate dehydrogenase subunit VorB [Fibrobacteria bacterium]